MQAHKALLEQAKSLQSGLLNLVGTHNVFTDQVLFQVALKHSLCNNFEEAVLLIERVIELRNQHYEIGAAAAWSFG